MPPEPAHPPSPGSGATPAPLAPAEAPAPARLLLVDDEPGLRTAVQAYPEQAGKDPATLAPLARKLGYSGHLVEREQVLPGNTR